jgi:multidrug efflux pump subunit AcrA (membrane-fusion protein)
MMMTTSTRLRGDLQAAPVEDTDGVLYYDVSDPKTGNTLRLFDFEWLLAQRLDGQHNFDELARWTESQLGFATSRGDLEVYADRLQQLGLLDTIQVSSVVAKPPVVAPAPVQAAPLPPPPIQPPPRAVERATPAPLPPEPQLAEPKELRLPPPALDLDEGLMGRPVITLPAPRPTPPPVAKPAPPPAVEVKSVKPEPAKVEPPAVSRSPLRDAIDQLPAPAETPAQPVVTPPPVQTELQAAAAEASALSASPEPTADSAGIGSPQTPIQPVAEAVVVAKPADPLPVIEVAKPAEPVAVKPAIVEVAKPAEPPTVKAPVLAVAKPAEPAPLPAPAPSGGGGKWVFIVLLLLAGLGAAYYFLVYLPKASPPAVSVQLVAANPTDQPRTFPSPAEVKKAEPQSIKIDSDGTVVEIQAENAEVAADAALVVLDSKTRLDKEQADLKAQIEKLQKKADSAKGKAKQTAQAQLTDKQARQAEVESLLKKASILAARPGTVTKVAAKVGQALTAGSEVLSVTDKALVAELKVPSIEAQGMKQGQDVKLLTMGADHSPLPAQLISLKVDGESATLVLSLPLDTSAKVGDKLSLQLGMLEKAVRLPSSALVEGNKVYVVQDGKAALRQVTVANRDSDSVLVQGLGSGDQIVSSPSLALHDGSAIQAAAH